MPVHILWSSRWHSSTSMVGLFFHFQLIHLICHPVIWLFPHLKDFLGGQHFANDLQVKQEVAKFFCDCPMSFYAMGIERLIDRYKNVSFLLVIMLIKQIISCSICGFIFTAIGVRCSTVTR